MSPTSQPVVRVLPPRRPDCPNYSLLHIGTCGQDSGVPMHALSARICRAPRPSLFDTTRTWPEPLSTDSQCSVDSEYYLEISPLYQSCYQILFARHSLRWTTRTVHATALRNCTTTLHGSSFLKSISNRHCYQILPTPKQKNMASRSWKL
jgi:hypothetical protein